jgi:hypothetical protein
MSASMDLFWGLASARLIAELFSGAEQYRSGAIPG